MKAWIGAIAVALATSSAVVQAGDGNELLNQCQQAVRFIDDAGKPSDNRLNVGHCIGMVEGVRTMMLYIDSAQPANYKTCFPKGGISNAQAARIVVKYLNDNPAKLNEDGPYLIFMGLHQAYPCK